MAESEKFIPPYGVSWDTYIHTIEKMGEEGLPGRVDRSYLSTQSGNVQTYFMQALRSFGLIEENGQVTTTLKQLASAGDERPSMMADLLHLHYATIIDLGQTNSTQGQLEETWTETFNQSGDTRRKAVRFFLAAAGYAGIPVGKLWKSPRASTPGMPKKAKAKPKDDREKLDRTPGVTLPTGDSYQVTLLGGGTVTVVVAESHFNLSKNRTDRDFVNGLVDAMTDYAEGSGQGLEEESSAEDDADEEGDDLS